MRGGKLRGCGRDRRHELSLAEKAYRVPDDLLELAETTMQVNLAVGVADTERAAQREIRALLA